MEQIELRLKEISITMKKKYALLLTGLLTLSLAAGCGSKTEPAADAAAPVVAESQTQEAEAPATEQTESVPATEALGEVKTLTGTIDEIKDFMFVVTDEAGTAYEFDFETKPEGLDDVAVGDQVVVNYTGEVSEVDAFTGMVLSVEKQ